MEPLSEPQSAGKPDITVLPDPTLDVTIVVPYYNPGAGCARPSRTWCASSTRRA